MISRNIPLFALILLLLAAPLYAQSDSRVGTTAANFLEMGFGGAGNAMGDAYVSMGRDLSSVYWNPAGLGYMERNQVILNYQPWILDINTSAVSAAFANDRLGAIALTLYQTSYGEEKVTNTDMQTGTGETFDGQDIAVSATYGRKLAQWFSFGASAKYVTSRIWHERAGAVALDLGAIVNTPFFAWSDKPGDGLNIGMSISNYGTKMSYNGIDLKETVDINPDENGNYAYIPTRFETEGWELPLVARIGASINPLISGGHRLTV
ncbi:MAG TPA: PorV/PorQ family protein, partial [bacterium]|nr:PorV/PorQ family protein [bacterium]